MVISTCGHFSRMAATRRWTSFNAPAEASIPFEAQGKVARPQLGAEQVISAEDVQGQVAVVVVVAVKEPSRLLAVQGNVRGVEIQDDTRGRLLVGLQEQVEEQVPHRRTVHGDLLVAALPVCPDGGQLQPIQRALARQGLALVPLPSPILAQRVLFPHQNRQQRMVTKGVVIVEVLVTQTQSVDPLGHEIFDGVLDQVRVAMIGEAGGELPDDARGPLRLPQQYRPGVRGDLAPVEPGHNFSFAQGLERKRLLGTLCLHQAAPP